MCRIRKTLRTVVQTASVCAVASTACADQFLSNLDQTWDDFATPNGWSYLQAFGTGPGFVQIDKVTVEQWAFDPLNPSAVTLQIYREADGTLMGEFPNLAVSAAPTGTPDETTFIEYSPDSAVDLAPGTDYLVVVSELPAPYAVPDLMQTSSQTYNASSGWSLGTLSRGFYPFFTEPVTGVLKIQLSGSSVAVANQPPDISQAHASLPMLWPPNGKMVPLQIDGVTDPEGDPVTLTVLSIMQDEPVANSAKNQSRDAMLGADGRFQLRAERLASGNGRVYTVTFRASDGNVENDVIGTVKVGVPHDTEGHPIAIDGGPLYNSLGF
jgi:hypothetical protein